MTLFEFATEQSVQNWQPEDDVVMGGVSSSALTYTTGDPEGDNETGVGRFSGDVSLDNGGGFAQVLYDKTSFDLTGFQGAELRVKGDDKTYELRFETDAKRVTYVHAFVATGQWQQLRLAFADFQTTFRGEKVTDAPPLNLAAIKTVSFLINDGQMGKFELLIDEVKTYQ